MKKKNARIMWSLDKNSLIDSLIVEEFIIDEHDFLYKGPHHLYKLYKRDIGNADTAWNEINLLDIVMYLSSAYGFKDGKTAMKAFHQLIKIDEFENQIKNCSLFWSANE